MSQVVGYSAGNTQLLVDSRPLEHLELIYIDHGRRRLRARVMYRPDAEGAPTQVVLRSLENGHPVLLALVVPNMPAQRWAARLRFCRTRLHPRSAIRTTVEFSLSPIASESTVNP